MSIDDIKALAALGATEVTIHPDGRIVAKFEKPAPMGVPSVWVSPNTTSPPFPPPSSTVSTLVQQDNDTSCMHRNCATCGGTGKRKDGLGACIHMMNCICPRCSPTCMVSTSVSSDDDINRLSTTRTTGELRVRMIPLPSRGRTAVTS